MAKLQIDFACGDYDRVRALRDGAIQPEGIELNFIPMERPEETFWRMAMHRGFEVSEMSLGSFVAGRARGDFPFVGIPAFVSRVFRHSAAYVNVNAGIEKPEDLKGKRVGIPEWQMTATIWLRGALQDDYGVRPSDLLWVWGGQEHVGRREKVPVHFPPDVSIEPAPPGKTLSPMLERGEIDALFSARMPEPFIKRSPQVRRLFPNYREVEADYFRRTGIFPIMHLIVIRNDIYERHPWVAVTMLKALVKAKQLCAGASYDTGALPYMLPWMIDDIESARVLMGDDYWPYGLEANRKVLETFVRYAYEQGIAARKISADELFPPETGDTFKT